MSVFSSGLSRLRNSFRRKSGCPGEAGARRGVDSGQGSRGAASEGGRSQRGRAGPSSPGDLQAADSRPPHRAHPPLHAHPPHHADSPGRPASSSHPSHHAQHSPGREVGAGSALHSDPQASTPPGTHRPAPFSSSHTSVAVTSPTLTKEMQHVNEACDVDYDDAAQSLDGSDVSADVCDVHCEEAPDVRSCGDAACLSHQCSPPLTVSGRQGQRTGGGVDGADSPVVSAQFSPMGNTTLTHNHPEEGACEGAKDSPGKGAGFGDETGDTGAGVVSGENRPLNQATVDSDVSSDVSSDALPFADASDGLQDPRDQPLPLRELLTNVHTTSHSNDHTACHTIDMGDSGAPTSEGEEPAGGTDTPPGRSGTASPRQVSFGSHLEEDLGRAEHAQQEDGCGEEAVSASGCDIPHTLRESPSMSALHKDPAEDLTCRVCQQLLCRPLILPCLHTFCWRCVADLQTSPIGPLEERDDPGSEGDPRAACSPSPVQGSSTSSSSLSHGSRPSCEGSGAPDDQAGTLASDRVVLCPTCLKETRVSATLHELPRNYVAERKVARYQSTHRGVVRQECDSCGDHGNACVVTACCVQCGENLCALCELSHRRQKRTKRHQLLDIMAASQPPSQHAPRTANKKKGRSHVTSRARPSGRILCGFHPEEEVKLYCLICDLSVCRDCVLMAHRDHDCRFLSKELFQGQLGDIQTRIRAVVPHITSVDTQLQKLADCQDNIHSRARDVTQEIETHIDGFLAAIERHRQQLIQQVGRVVEEKQHALHVTERHLRQVRQDVEHTCRFVADLIESASDMEILSVKRLVTARLTSLQEVSASPLQPISTFIKFSPSEAGEVIDNFQMFGKVVSRRASAATSVLFTEGLSTARVGVENVVGVEVKGEDGTPYTGTDVTIKAWVLVHTSAIRSLAVAVQRQKKGGYSLRFTPEQTGTHLLHVALHSQPLRDSPVRFRVKGAWRVHRGVWHCCTVCSTGRRRDVHCACRGVMPGGLSQGCCHGEAGHPGGPHWSCCGKMVQSGQCGDVPRPPTSPLRQVTL